MIPLSYTPIDRSALAEVLGRYQSVDHTQMVRDFEAAIADKTGAAHAVCLQSGTAAIHIALLLAGIRKGDQVIAPTFTYIASVSPLLYVGASPVFVDCDAKTWNMDLDLVEEALRKSKKVKAIMVVHNYGNPCDLNAIYRLAARYGVAVVEDAAEGIGSTIGGAQVGTRRLGVISFNNNKINTTIGGGVLLTDRAKLAARARFLSAHAREDLPYYKHKELGFNYRMSSLAAAYGLAQWDHLDGNVQRRREIYENYERAFAGMDIAGQQEIAGARSNRWLSTFALPSAVRKLADRMKAGSIETRPLWNPLHTQPLFKGSRAFDRGVAARLFRNGICLPSSEGLSNDEQGQVISVVRSAVG